MVRVSVRVRVKVSFRVRVITRMHACMKTKSG